jgi:hypothetical protein
MRKIIVIILLIIILALILYTKKKENLLIDDARYKAVSNAIGKFIIDQETKLPNLTITKSLRINNIEFSSLILEYKYPVGSFYIQYPDSNINLSSKSDTIVTLFPESKTPAKMFGGVWIDMWTDESVYFRTGRENILLNSPAFETIKVCDTDISGNEKCKIKKTVDSRIDGFQDYALRDVSGWTSWAQAAMGNDKFPPECIESHDSLAGRKGCKIYIASGYSQCTNYSGVFTNCEKDGVGSDGNVDFDTGHQNTFDTNAFFKELYTDYEKYISYDEVRVKNRLIKVWKRIE